MKPYNQFIQDVTSGKLPSNKFVKEAVQRHINDLDRIDFHFDESAADHVIKFFKLLRHTKGEWKGKLFDLQPFQAFILAMIFGWKKHDGTRRFSKAYIEMARKNGKSELAAGIALYMLLMDGEGASEVFTLGTKFGQSKIVFDLCTSMARDLKREYPSMDARIGILRYNINVLETGSKLEALSSDSEKQDGLNPHCAIADELHAWKDGSLYKVMETGMGARLQPLLLSITTAGFDKMSFCFGFREVCAGVLKGTMKDDTLFAIIFTLDESDDWNDETVWCKANPNLGNAPYWHYMRTKYQSAVNEGEMAQIEFLTKNLNVWTNTSVAWIREHEYKRIVVPMHEDEFIGRACVGGMDLASRDDICVFLLTFRPTESDPVYRTISWFFCPEDKVNTRRRVDDVDYLQWVKDGFIIPHPGNTIDQRIILDFIVDKAQKFNIEYIETDPWNARQLIGELQEIGIMAEIHLQSMREMYPPTKELETLIQGQKIYIQGNPVMEWMMSNVETFVDTNGNYRIIKGRNRKKKVDGPVAWVMSIGGILKSPETNDYRGDGPMVL